MKQLLKIFLAAFTGIGVTLCGLFLGYGFYDKAPKRLPEAYSSAVKTTDITKTGENTVIRYIYHYNADGEEMFFEESAPKALQGLDIDGVRALMPGYEICELTEQRLVVKRNIEGRSNCHYSIGEKDGYVAVFFENGILKEKTTTPVEGLAPEIQAQLIKGVKVDGSENLIKCLEDIES